LEAFIKIAVTGGKGFLGRNLVERFKSEGHEVVVLDLPELDVCNRNPVRLSLGGVDAVHHLAYVNGTERFYEVPEQVLRVAVKGIVNVLEAAIENRVPEFFLCSSSEVYQTPPCYPTPEDVPLVVPDVMNPRYSYGGGKIISELMAINYGRKYFDRVCIYRPHNVYGPGMGPYHVIPQLTRRFMAGDLTIKGSGEETRCFNYIDDFVDGVSLIQQHGGHLEIYNIGTPRETRTIDLAWMIAKDLGLNNHSFIHAVAADGGTRRRYPDISKLMALGYEPKVNLELGLINTIQWLKSQS